MKILCYINHFFGHNSKFIGKSSFPPGTSEAELQLRAIKRKRYIQEVISQVNEMGEVDLRICGINGNSIVPIDIEFKNIKSEPLLMIYESLNHMAQFLDQYDYFINLEDDILLPEDTFKNIVEFDKVSLINEILLPNRLESWSNGESYCVDLNACPQWTQQRRKYNGKEFRVALNPHSGILILSREKFRYGLNQLDRNFRGVLMYNELDSAFAYFHSPFSLFRSEDIRFHHVIHLDKWLYSPEEKKYNENWKYRLKSLKKSDFIPPVFFRIISFLQKWIVLSKGIMS